MVFFSVYTCSMGKYEYKKIHLQCACVIIIITFGTMLLQLSNKVETHFNFKSLMDFFRYATYLKKILYFYTQKYII